MREGWEIKKLGDMSKIMYGHTAKASFESNGIKYLRITDIQNNSVDWDSVPSCPSLGDDFGKYELKYGDIVFARTGATTGKSYLIKNPPKAVFASYLIRVQTNPKEIEPEFLSMFFQSASYWNVIEAGISGSAQGGFNAKKLSGISVSIPPLPEQRTIVALLDAAFAKIDQAKANIEKNIENARELFQSKLNAVFSQRGEGWEERKLGDLISVKHGFAFKSKFFMTEGDYVLLTPGNYYETGGYRDRGEKQKYYVGEIPDGFILQKGDLLVAMTEQAPGLLGSPLIVPDSDKFLHNQRLGLVNVKDGIRLSNEFLFFLFNTKHLRDEVFKSGTGVKVRHTSPTKIGNVKVNVCFDENEQRRIVHNLKSLSMKKDNLIEMYSEKLIHLEDLKKSLLQKAFAGELTHSEIPT